MERRPIKFRAWDKDRSDWLDADELFISVKTEKLDGWQAKDGADHFVLMQSTGLHDKNGIEIYEGDILLNDEGSLLGYVYWEDAQMRCCWRYHKPRKDQRTDFFVSGHISQEQASDFEVIGNICENPELLQ